MRLAACLLVLTLTSTARADRLHDLANRWLAAVRAGKLDEVAKLTRLPLEVTARGVCFARGDLDHPHVSGVAGRRSLKRLIAAVRTCVPAGTRLIGVTDDSWIAIEWGGESISELRLTFDDAGRLTSIADMFSYGGP